MNLPKWAQQELSQEELNKIENAVVQAEKKTSGEIVPMIVHRSSTIGHVPVLILCLLTALYFALDAPYWQAEYLGDHWAWYFADILFICGATLFFSRLNWVQRNLISPSDRMEQVQMRAELEFYESNIRETKSGTGILLFVSLLERRAVVLADSSISEKFQKNIWSEVCETLISGLHSGSMAKGFCSAIEMSQEILTPHFPIQPDDVNELRNHLIVKD